MLDLLHQSSAGELEIIDDLVEWVSVKYASDVFYPTKIQLSQYVDKVFDTLNDNSVANTIYLHHEIEQNVSVCADDKILISSFKIWSQML